MKMIIDTDAGVDDAHALLLALTHPNCDVIAITTVTGNVQIDQVNLNVASVLAAVDQQVPIYAGAAQPLLEVWEDAKFFHGQDGLGDWARRPQVEPQLESEHAVSALIRLAREHAGDLTLVALAPLTNLALAVRRDPSFAQNISHLVIMGGAVNGMGNSSRLAAEYNFAADPEAAQIVLGSFPHCTLVGWEATLDYPLLWADYERITSKRTAGATFFKGITTNTVKMLRGRGFTGLLIPDPLAMAVALEPTLITTAETRYVTVEVGGTHARGQSVVNYTFQDVGAPNVEIVRGINMDGVIDLHARL